MKNTNFCKQVFYILVPLTVLAACQNKPRYPGPLTPEESLKTFHFADSLKAEIYATEPLVADPISIVFDDNGDAYVVEMADANMPDSLKGKGQIVLLKDTNKDGRADTSIVFATGLTEATTVLPWKDGLIVTAAPNILYMKDTDGDGAADSKEILFSGFFNKNDEAQITSLRFGVDNWIYANNDGEPGKVISHRNPSADSLPMKGADFRFRLDQNKFERTTGPGQYGQAIDDWGHRFFTKNSLHIQQVVIPWRYLHRNPFLPSSATHAIKNISDHDPIMYQITPAPYWRAVRTDRRNKEYKAHKLNRTEYAKDHFTGASGGTFYGGNALPSKFYGNIFTGDVSGNLVHSDVLNLPSDPHDPFYTAQRRASESKKEFLASTDSWFRPTNFAVGPDGFLYVVDMYRQHIETPVSIPEDLAAEMDFSAGSDKGRIYRIVPKDHQSNTYPGVNLDAQSSVDLVNLLSNPNRWQRLHAHQLLIERQDKSVIPAVKALFLSNADSRARIHALYVLEGLDALDADIVKSALKDAAAGIRENAAILSERYPECVAQLEKLIDDSSGRVAFQATLSLGEFNDRSVIPVFAHVLEKYGSNSWFRTAVLSSAAGSSNELMKLLMDKSFFSQKNAGSQGFLKDLAYTMGARNKKEEAVAFLQLLNNPSLRSSTLAGTGIKNMINGLETSNKFDAEKKSKLKEINKEADKDSQKAITDLKNLIANS